MLSRVHRRLASRVAAALVAVALSGAGSTLAQVAPRSPGAHVCRCPRGDHDCTCPVCRAAAVTAGARKRGSPPCHRRAGDAGERAPDRCCISSACHLPEGAAAIDGREAFTLLEGVVARSPPVDRRRVTPAGRPRDLARPPEVPPPRAAPRS